MWHLETLNCNEAFEIVLLITPKSMQSFWFLLGFRNECNKVLRGKKLFWFTSLKIIQMHFFHQSVTKIVCFDIQAFLFTF